MATRFGIAKISRYTSISVRIAAASAALGLTACGSEPPDDPPAVVTSALSAAQCDYFAALTNDHKVNICHPVPVKNNKGTITGYKKAIHLNISASGCKGHDGHEGDYIDIRTDDAEAVCDGQGCFPAGAPFDGSVECCPGLAPDTNGLCAPCKPGTAGSDGTCSACAAGSVQPLAGQTSCNACGAGTYDDGTEVCAACALDDGKACTDDSCDPTNGAVKHANDDTNSCSDDNACTSDVCAAGACVGKPNPIASDDNVCTDDRCDPKTGEAVYVANDLNKCSDDNACTSDACAAGKCVGKANPIVGDNNVCTDDSCDPKTGNPVYTPNDGNPCSDDNACTSDACVGGSCVSKANPIAGDGNDCTDDSCDPLTGAPIYTADDGNSCSDGNVCTSDHCSAGQCASADNCDEICTPVNGGFACACTLGYALAGDGRSCVDVDECATNNGGCGATDRWTCENRIGAAPACHDVDECATNNGGCGPVAYWRCTNNTGAAPTCADRDECATNNGGCGAATCVDNIGGPPSCNNLSCALGTIESGGECKAMCDATVLASIPSSDNVTCSPPPVSSSGNDTVNDCGGNEMRYSGSGGNDTVHGWGEDDIICGGSGDDILYGDDGDDWLFGESNTDELHGGAGNDTLFGGDSATYQRLWGDGGDDLIVTNGAGKVDPGDGNDIIAVNVTGAAQSTNFLVFNFNLALDRLGVAGGLSCTGWQKKLSSNASCGNKSACGSPMSNANVTSGPGCSLVYKKDGSDYYNVTLCGSYSDADIAAALSSLCVGL